METLEVQLMQERFLVTFRNLDGSIQSRVVSDLNEMKGFDDELWGMFLDVWNS